VALSNRDHEVHGEGVSPPEAHPRGCAFTDQFGLDGIRAGAGVEQVEASESWPDSARVLGCYQLAAPIKQCDLHESNRSAAVRGSTAFLDGSPDPGAARGAVRRRNRLEPRLHGRSRVGAAAARDRRSAQDCDTSPDRRPS
jgi:hypothetical protein